MLITHLTPHIYPSSTGRNVAIGPGEKRYSFTQYSAGGLFRWVEYGLRTYSDMVLHDPEMAERVEAAKPSRWKSALDLYSTFDELLTDHGIVNP